MMRRKAMVVFVAALAASGCARNQFQRELSDQDWVAAARAFDSDSSLMNNEHALYRAGLLFGSPGRPTYDPTKARTLLMAFLRRFPDSSKRTEVSDRLALLDDIVSVRRDAAARQRDLQARIDAVTADSRLLRERLDSASVQGEQTRHTVARLEADLHDREEQVRALRIELQRLKEIDLKPRRPPGAPDHE